MNKIIIAAALIAVSSAVSAQQQNPPSRPTVQGDNPTTRTNEGGSSYNDTQNAPAQRAPANSMTKDRVQEPMSSSAAAPVAPATRTTTVAPATRTTTVARAPKADRN